MSSGKKFVHDRETRPVSAAFHLSQVGAHAARRFSERVQTIGLTAPEAGILRMVNLDPGISQQALAEHLGVLPSRMVVLIDALEKKRLIERRPSAEDRRTYALHLTRTGTQMLEQLRHLATEHDKEICGALDDKERAILAELCRRIAAQQGLTPGVHPGYRQVGKNP
jgi:DNA-binding MarR family transcriptional regulator